MADKKHEVGLQAVLLADSFTTTFRPMTLDGPKVLCPLNNVTMLDFAIEFLAGAGVEELFVFCVNGAVEDHIEGNYSSSKKQMMQVHCVRDGSCTNAGDALRELDKRDVIQSNPFILMSGDTITNVDLKGAIGAHKDRYSKDNSAIMTLLFQRTGGWSVGQQLATSTSRDLVVGLTDQEGRLVLYESHATRGVCPLPTCFIFQNHGIEIRRDLSDTGIAICSPDVLARFSDEFDYRHIYTQFVANSVAEEEDGLQNRIYSHILQPHEYAAQIHDPKTYASVSRDLLRRWCYPVVPDNLPSGYDKIYRYQLRNKNQYRECKQGGTTIGRSTKLQAHSSTHMIGSHVSIGEHCHLQGNNVLGHHVVVHDHVSIRDSHLWDNVTIESNVSITDSILCQNVTIHQGATIPRGCIIGKGCVVGRDVTLPEFTRLTLCPKDVEEQDDDDDLFDDDSSDDDDDDSSDDDDDGSDDDDFTSSSSDDSNNNNNNIVSNHEVVGKDGLGRVWIPPISSSVYYEEHDSEFEEEEDEQLEQARRVKRCNTQSMGYDPSHLYQHRLQQQMQHMELYDEYQSEDDADADNDNAAAHTTTGGISNDNHNNTSFGNPFSSSSFDNANHHNHHPNSSSMDVGTSIPIVGRQKGVDVVQQFKTICLEHDVSSPIENLAIELNSFKFSQNATFADVIVGSVQAILQRVEWSPNMTAKQVLVAFQKDLQHWKPLLQRMAYSIVEEKAILTTIETAATTPTTTTTTTTTDNNSSTHNIMATALSKEPAFRFMLQTLHDQEVVTEEAILSWAQDQNTLMEQNIDWKNTPNGKLFLQQPTQDFLQWLEEDSESDSDDDSDDDSTASNES